MSFYGSGNAFDMGYPYLDMYAESQNENIDNIAATKLENRNTNASNPNETNYQENKKNAPCIVSLSNALPHFQLKKNSEVLKEEKNDSNIQLAEKEEQQPELNIIITNIVATFNVRCHLNLRHIALNGANVEYIKETLVVIMKFKKPKVTANIYSSGKVVCTGATSNEDAKKAARKCARSLQKLGFEIRFTEYKVVNVLSTCAMDFGINIVKFTEKYKHLTCYEPELNPGATYKIKDIKATLKVFTTGSITITAPSTDNVQRAVEHIFPLVYEFRTPKPLNIRSQYKNTLMFLRRKGGYASSDEENHL